MTNRNGNLERRVQSFLLGGLLLLLAGTGAKLIAVGENVAELRSQAVSMGIVIAELKLEMGALKVQASTAALAANTAATAATTAAALAATAATTAAALAAQSAKPSPKN